jgi:diguanylate cyclase (GGDEF)-like protein
MEDVHRRAPYGVVIMSTDQTVLWIDERAAGLVKCSPADIIGSQASRWIKPEERERGECPTGGADRYEASLLDRDGEERTVRVTRTVIEDGAGQACATVSLVEDLTQVVVLDREIASAERWLDAIVDSAPIILIGGDVDGVITFAHGQALGELGLHPKAIVGRSAFELFDAVRPDVVAQVRSALAGREVHATMEADTEVVDVWFRPVCDPDGVITGVIAIGTVVTERAWAERQQHELIVKQQRREAQQAAVASLGQLALRAGDFRALCDECVDLTSRALAGGDTTIYLDDGHEDGLIVLAGRGWAEPHIGVRRARRERDTPVGYLLASSAPVRSDDVYHDARFGPATPPEAMAGSVLGVHIQTRVGVVGALIVSRPEVDPFGDRDASFLTSMANVLGAAYDAERSAEELRHYALHDSLTGLPNRALLSDRLEHALGQAAQSQKRVGVIVCDLDRFKLVNDSYGHPVGDALLNEVATRLTGAVRPGDTVARFGGDEFVVVCAEVDDEGDVVRVAERLAAVLAEPVTLGQERVFTSASMGIAIGERGTPAADLLRDADSAMYRAKDEGRGRWEVFDDVLRARARQRLDTETALRQAIENDELVLHYQPIVSVSNGRLLGAEALVRWQHPERGLLEPVEFIPIAEESGLIRDVGEWVLRAAAEQTAEWVQADLWEHRATSVNVAAAQMDDEMPTRVAAAAGAVRLDPARLRVEITETVLLRDTKAAERVLRELRSIGVHASVDDFGTGYSSLAYLAELSVDTLKIDRAFVQGLLASHAGRTITEAVTSLAHSLGMRAVAEGVESSQQVNVLRALGCDAMQGFLIGRPMEPQKIAELASR